MRRSLSLMAYQEYELETATKKKFWNPKKWFKRKNKAQEDAVIPVEIIDKDVIRSRSTSELSITEDQVRRRSGSSMHPGLSVSHDSVFHSPNSGSDIEIDAAHSSSSLSISHPQIDVRLQTELSERLRSRRGRGDTSEDDEGLPHSPCNSPTTTEALTIEKTAIKDLPPKSHSTCSDGSLLSMGSSGMDEESSSQQSRHSSKLSLHERRGSDQDSDLELGPSTVIQQLNHSAAHHRVSVRPKRRAPHRTKKVPQLSSALPTTLEVNEDSSIRSMTPDNVSKEILTEYSMSTRTALTETQMKCSSLPPGLAPSVALDSAIKLARSRSNAGQDFIEEDPEKEERSSDKSFFDRIFPRRSAKKRKSKEEKTVSSTATLQQTQTKQLRIESKPIPAPRSGAAARQRIQPIDLPPSPDKDFDLILPKMSPDKPFLGTSPLAQELENRFKQKMNSTSLSSPQSLKDETTTTETTVISSKIEISKHEIKKETRSEDIKSKVKIPGLSSLQQKVLSLNDDTEDVGFKSLTSLPPDVNIAKPVTKSHSFKTVKPKPLQEVENNFAINQTKAASLDSVKNLDEPDLIVESKSEEMKMETSFSDLRDFNDFSNITISGPSHTAIVNVTSNTADSYDTSNTIIETVTAGDNLKEVTTKELVSVTKIQLKRESTQITQSTVTVPKNAVPEFLNRQLNKVEKPVSNVVFSTTTPRVTEELIKTKSVLETDNNKLPRKFSQEDIEIIEKSEEEEETKISTLITTVSQPRFKKNEPGHRRKSSSSDSSKKESSLQGSRSQSLDSLKGDESSDRSSSQDSLDKLDDRIEEKKEIKIENVVLRKRSLMRQKNDEEPELMKVFARRSLKLKDSDVEAVNQQVASTIDSSADSKTRDSDKENQEDSPKEERKRSITKDYGKIKEPFNETKIVPKKDDEQRKFVETEVQLRKPTLGNNFYARAFSVAAPKQMETEIIKKQPSFNERRKTDNWITNMKNGDDVMERKISQDEILTGISPKSDFISEDLLTERKNFNQRKAEWEKRAQEAQKKSVP